MGMEGVFWTSAFVIIYCYLGYPILLAAWARLASRPVAKGPIDGAREWPSISIILAARNEAARLPARITNLLELNYSGRREIIVVSDGSTDGTVDVLGRFRKRASASSRCLPAASRSRSTRASRLRRATSSCSPTPASSSAPTPWSSSPRTSTTSRVGGATGELMLDCEGTESIESTIGDGIGLYWKYEKWLRRKESAVWSTLGATGAIYALRRRLWTPLPADALLDDVLAPMRAVVAGYRVVFEERARAFDRTSPDAAAEARRKTRTLAGNYQILAQEPRLLVPILNPVWLQYASHKIGRLLVPWCLLAILASSAVLAASSWLYFAAFCAQAAFYGLADLGAWLDARERRTDQRLLEPDADGAQCR